MTSLLKGANCDARFMVGSHSWTTLGTLRFLKHCAPTNSIWPKWRMLAVPENLGLRDSQTHAGRYIFS